MRCLNIDLHAYYLSICNGLVSPDTFENLFTKGYVILTRIDLLVDKLLWDENVLINFVVKILVDFITIELLILVSIILVWMFFYNLFINMKKKIDLLCDIHIWMYLTLINQSITLYESLKKTHITIWSSQFPINTIITLIDSIILRHIILPNII